MSSVDAKRFLAFFGHDIEGSADSLIGWIAQYALAAGPLPGMTLDEVSLSIESLTGMSVDRVEIRSTIERNKALEIRITNDEPPHCVISASAREAALRRFEEGAQLENRVLGDWASQVARNSPLPANSSETWLANDLPSFFYATALTHGAECVELVYGGKRSKKFLEDLDTSVWDILSHRPKEYVEYCKDVFPSFFLQATGQQALFTAKVFDRTFELCRLNMAPNVSKLLIDQLSGLTIYLDTNVVFRLLGLHGPEAHLDACRIIRLTKEAKAAVRITPRTAEEFRTAATRYLKHTKPPLPPPPESLLQLDVSKDDRSFFKDYFELTHRVDKSSATWTATLENLERVLDRFGVQVWLEKTREVETQQRDKIDNLATKLFRETEERESKKPERLRKVATLEKCEHDAFHIFLINELRPRTHKSFTEARFWFVTSHYALTRERVGRERPAAISLEKWHQLLRSVLPRADNFPETLLRNLRSPLLQAHSSSFSSAHEEIAKRLATYKGLTSDHFAAVLSDRSLTALVAKKDDGRGSFSTPTVIELLDSRIAEEARAERERRIEAQTRSATARDEADKSRRAKEAAEAARNEAEMAREVAQREAKEAAARARSLEQDLESKKSTNSSLQTEIKEANTELDGLRRLKERAIQLTKLIASIFIAVVCVFIFLKSSSDRLPGANISTTAILVILVGTMIIIWTRHRAFATAAVLVIEVLLGAMQVQPLMKEPAPDSTIRVGPDAGSNVPAPDNRKTVQPVAPQATAP